MNSVKQTLGSRARQFAKSFTRKAKLTQALSPCLPDAICIDVGASYYPHAKWYLLLESPQTQWIAVEPNKQNIAYIQQWAWASKVSACTTGLSKDGGRQTLYVTNVDSGSSLLEPVIPASMSRRVLNFDYFFPVRPVDIETLTLPDTLKGRSTVFPIFVKLDTQGTELSILSGAEEWFRQRRVVGVELEATLLAQPIMQGSGKFWEATQYLESHGFELLHIDPIYGPSRIGIKTPRGRTYINECDAIFALRQDVAAELSVEYRASLFAFYLTNKFCEEALLMLEADTPMGQFLAGRGCDLSTLKSTVRAMA